MPCVSFVLFFILFTGCAQYQAPTTNANISNQTSTAPPVCNDSKANANLSFSGSISIGSVIYKDACKDGSSVRKYLCLSGAPASKVVICPVNSSCIDGACVMQENEAQPVISPPIRPCIDSDNSQDFHIQGTVSINSAGTVTNYTDKCNGNYDMVEYFCQNDSMGSTNHHCDNGERCQDGACITLEKTCTDTNINDSSIGGTTTLYGGGVVIESDTDSCVSGNEKTDFLCQNDSIQNQSIQCGSDEYCNKGACLKYCQDYDSGKDYFTGSYVVGQYGTFYDNCTNSTALKEYYCGKNDLPASVIYNCPGYCFQNRCIQESDTTCRESSSGHYVRISSGSTVILQQNDTCEDYQTIRHYLCGSGGIDYTETSCDNSEFCYAGSCKEITTAGCYESRAASSSDPLHTFSYVVLTYNDSIKQVKENVCNSDYELTEYSCDADTYRVSYVRCPTDEACIGNICVYPYTCNETDDGISLQPGSATIYDQNRKPVRTERDACFDTHSIWETYCDKDGKIAYAQLPCPDNMTCDPATGSCE